MRRSICLSEPSHIYAGEVSNWKFTYTTSTSLPKGARLKFDLASKGRDFDWEIPQVNLKEKKNLIWAQIAEGKPIQARLVEMANNLVPAFEFVLPSEVKAGDAVSIFMGVPNKQEGNKKGNRAQTVVQRRRPFHLYIDPKGKGDYRDDPEVFMVDVRGSYLHHIRIVAPSIVAKNKRFDVTVRFEDSFGNLTNNAPEGTLIELSYEHLRENLTWKLFVPETGFINLPNLYFNEPGIYKIQLRNLQNQSKFYSSPIKCFTDYDKSLYWGLLHGESERVDSAENIESCLRHVRDERSLQFFATSCFESAEETSNDVWKTISAQIAEFNEDHRFTTFLGFQWQSEEEGLRHVIYSKDNKPILRKKDSKNSSIKKIFKSHTPKELMAIPCFSMAKGIENSLEDFTPEYERVVEIYNAWGSSECSQKEGNTRPITSESKKGVFSAEKGSIRKALNRNCRFGFVAGGFDDRGVYADLFDTDQVQYSGGLTAILAIEQTREALFLALTNRSCYATTGERIVLGFFIAGAQMGAEINTKAKPGLAINRHLTGFASGTTEIKEVTIIRNGVELHTYKPGKSDFEFALDDMEPLDKVVLTSPDDRPSFAYYYLRVTQKDGHIGWSSPIWIDYPDIATSSSKKTKAKKT